MSGGERKMGERPRGKALRAVLVSAFLCMVAGNAAATPMSTNAVADLRIIYNPPSDPSWVPFGGPFDLQATFTGTIEWDGTAVLSVNMQAIDPSVGTVQISKGSTGTSIVTESGFDLFLRMAFLDPNRGGLVLTNKIPVEVLSSAMPSGGVSLLPEAAGTVLLYRMLSPTKVGSFSPGTIQVTTQAPEVPTPEPATALLLMVGLGGAAGASYLRRRATPPS
jgi:hypothetical protein